MDKFGEYHGNGTCECFRMTFRFAMSQNSLNTLVFPEIHVHNEFPYSLYEVQYTYKMVENYGDSSWFDAVAYLSQEKLFVITIETRNLYCEERSNLYISEVRTMLGMVVDYRVFCFRPITLLLLKICPGWRLRLG